MSWVLLRRTPQTLGKTMFALVFAGGAIFYKTFVIQWFLRVFLNYTRFNYWTILACLILYTFVLKSRHNNKSNK
mgnify:CR=1 FL=1